MEDCRFCKIVKGELPKFLVYEDENYLGFLNIAPRLKGHSLLIPKKHYRWVYDIPEFGKYWEAVLKLTNAMKRAFQTDWITYFTYGALPHGHVHILPRQTGNDATVNESDVFPPVLSLNEEEMKEIAQKIFEQTKK